MVSSFLRLYQYIYYLYISYMYISRFGTGFPRYRSLMSTCENLNHLSHGTAWLHANLPRMYLVVTLEAILNITSHARNIKKIIEYYYD